MRGWDRRNAYYYQIICALADHYGFDPETPFSSIPKEIQAVILYGSGEEKINFQFQMGTGKPKISRHPFEGIIANMERRYRETDSQMVRDELSKYLAQQTCSDLRRRAPQSGRAACVCRRHTRCITVTRLPIKQTLTFFQQLNIPGHRGEIAAKINKEIQERLEFLVNVGLDYLTLDRSADTLSGGEAQRIRLASQIGAGLVGVMYVLDEPSIGLHQRDNQRLLNTLFRLRDLGNTVIVVEHDEDAIRAAQYIVDIGPGAGVHGGQIVAQGTPEQILANPEFADRTIFIRGVEASKSRKAPRRAIRTN